MNLRPLLLSLAVTAVLAPMMSVEAKNPPRPSQMTGNTSQTGSPEGTPTLSVTVQLGGVSTNLICGAPGAPTAGNTVRSINLGPNAVVTGVGASGGYTSFSPSWRSEVLAVFRGANSAETIQLGFSADESSGAATFNFAPLDITTAGFPNITTGPSGILNIELCEDFDDASANPDATFNAGTTLTIACFNCTDPNAVTGVEALPAPAMSTWSLVTLLLALGLAGGIAVRRFS